MAYKRNPMRSERVCSLSRSLCNTVLDLSHTHATQWLERSLDDSAIRRMAIPRAFMTTDAVLDICANIVHGLEVWPHVIKKVFNNLYIYTYTHTHIHTHCTHTHTYTHTHTHTHIAHTHTYTHTHIAHTHTYTYTHCTHTHSKPFSVCERHRM